MMNDEQDRVEENNQNDSQGKQQEEVKQQGTEGVNESTDSHRESDYERSRRLWKLYLARKITATELNEGLLKDGGLNSESGKVNLDLDKVKDLFNAEEI